MSNAALIRGDDNGLHVRSFESAQDAAAASSSREIAPEKPKRPRTPTRRPITKTTQMLRPADISANFGISPSTLHYYCEALPESERLPSYKLPGKRKTPKGVRLVSLAELTAWLARWRTVKA